MFTPSTKGLFFLSFLLAFTFLAFGSSGAASGTASVSAEPLSTPNGNKPVYASYKGVTIGMPAAQVREKLGNPADSSDVEDDFKFSDFEFTRVFYDQDKTVRVISIMFTGDLKAAPECKTVVGTEASAKPDGALHKMVQYPDAGFWISYVRTAAPDSIVIITMQKMAKEN